MPDKFTSVFAPFAIYWIFSLFFHAIDTSGLFEQYRIHEPEDEKKKNRVTVKQVIWGVLLQQVIQTALALVWLEDDGEGMGPFRDHASSLLGWKEFVGKVAGKATMDRFGDSFAQGMYWWAIPVFQFFFASYVPLPRERNLTHSFPDSYSTPGSTSSTATSTPTNSSTATCTRGTTGCTCPTRSEPSTTIRWRVSYSTRSERRSRTLARS